MRCLRYLVEGFICVAAIVVLAAVTGNFAESCAYRAGAAVEPAGVPTEARPEITVRGVEATGAGVRILRSSYTPRDGAPEEVCYYVVATMGGMAAGKQAAVDCLSPR